MARWASTSRTRRALLGAGLLAPLSARTAAVRAADYASPEQALDAIGELEAEMEARLLAVAAAQPGARGFASSLRRDLQRHRRTRRELRRRFALAAEPAREPAAGDDPGLDGLRGAVEALAYAYAEGLPALGDAVAVARLGPHLVDVSRHLTIVDLWIEQEQARG